MAHIILYGDESRCAPIRAQIVRWGLTVGSPAAGDPAPEGVGIDACDVVLVVGGAAAGLPGPDAVSDGGRGAAPAAPRFYLSDEEFVDGCPRSLLPRLLDASRLAGDCRLALGGGPLDTDDDVHMIGHELRSPLTAIKTALELMESDLGNCQADPADIESQLKMLQIALRNVRRLHRAIEWSQILLAGPRVDTDPLTAANSAPAPQAELAGTFEVTAA
jgi:hypothetical protein